MPPFKKPTLLLTLMAAAIAFAAAIPAAASANIGNANLQPSPTITDLGDVSPLSLQQTTVVTFTNNGNAPYFYGAGNTQITSDGPWWSVDDSGCVGSTLSTFQSCDIIVHYSPANGLGLKTLQLKPTVSGSDISVAATISIYEAMPNIQFSDQPLVFKVDKALVVPYTRTEVISNIGLGDLHVKNLSMPINDANAFIVSTDPACGGSASFTVPEGGSCILSVTFNQTPGMVGSYNGELCMDTNDFAKSSPCFDMRADLGYQSISATLPALAFGGRGVTSGPGAPITQTLTADGIPDTQTTSIAVTGANASDFSVSNSTCGSTMATGDTCTFDVTFDPSAPGARTADVNVDYGASGTHAQLSFPVSGTGTASSFAMSPTALSFGSRAASTGSSEPQTLTLTNTGNIPAQFNGLKIVGADASDFVLGSTDCGKSLPGGATCQATVAFAPGSAGAKTASLQANYELSAVSATPVIDVQLSGTGTVPAPVQKPQAKAIYRPKKNPSSVVVKYSCYTDTCKVNVKVHLHNVGRDNRFNPVTTESIKVKKTTKPKKIDVPIPSSLQDQIARYDWVKFVALIR